MEKYIMPTRQKMILLSGLLLFAVVTSNATDNSIFEYRKVASRTITTPADISVIQFDEQFFAKTDNLYRDLRITASDGIEIPFVTKQLTFSKNITDWRQRSCKIIALKKTDNTVTLEVEQLVKLNNPVAAISMLKIITSNRNFEKNITIEGSNDRKKWQIIAQNQPFFDYSSIVNLDRNKILFPATKCKYFKVVINNYREESESPLYQITREKRQGKDYSTVKKMLNRNEGIKISAIELYKKRVRMVNEKPAKKDYAITITSIEQREKVTEINIATQRQPLTGFKLTSSSKNFSRRITIAYQTDKGKWRNFTSGIFEQITVKGFQSNQLTIRFPESRHTTYKITIDNLDNKPLAELGVTATGNIYQALMLGAPQEKIYLLYGGQVTMPHYDINAALSRIADPVQTIYKLSPEEPNPDYQAGPRKINYKLIFICLISLTALILAVILVKNFGKLDAMTED
jgi:hypothetical protein